MSVTLHSNTLSKVKRHKLILKLLGEKKSITLKELEEQIKSSRITIQRDLVELENKALVKRTHGGVMLKNHDLSIYGHDERLFIQMDKKRKIAKKASTLIKPNMYICMDASSTVYYLHENIFPRDVVVVTTGIDTFLKLQNRDDVQVVLTGGRMNKKSMTLVGSEAISVIKQFYFDLIFFSADSIIEDKGIFDSNEETSIVSKTIINQGDKKILLFDSTKTNNKNGSKICDIDVIDFCVTDDPSDPFFVEQFGDKIL